MADSSQRFVSESDTLVYLSLARPAFCQTFQKICNFFRTRFEVLYIVLTCEVILPPT